MRPAERTRDAAEDRAFVEIVDSHCHLDFPDFDADRDGVIARAAAAGVRRMMTIGAQPSRLSGVRAIAERYPGVTFSAGLHPLHAHSEAHPSVEALVEWAAHPKMAAIGEAGLDYHYQRATAALQAETLLVQIEAARRTGLPLVIHARDADADIAEILEREHRAGAFSAVMHCFTASADLAERALALGFYLSISGVATFKTADALRAIFAAVPLDRLLVETDAPYLAPIPYRGKRNEPAFVVETARVGAEIRGLSLAEFAAATCANFDRLFPKAAAAGARA